MRRFLVMLAAAMVLAACGTDSTTLTVADPPQATVVTGSTTAQADKIINEWKTTVPEELALRGIKPETIQQQVYQSSATLEQVAEHYQTLTTQGWVRSARMPGIQGNYLLDGYDHSQISTVVIGAIDASQYGGTGTIIYTARGNK